MKTREEIIEYLKELALSPASDYARIETLLEEREWEVEAVNGGSPHKEPYLDEVEYIDLKSGKRSWDLVLRFEPNEKSYEDYEDVFLSDEDLIEAGCLENCIKALDEGVMHIGGRTLKIVTD